ncbi:MAG TPA: glycosyltransferase [Gemmatimonadales bacterium]|jgi:glycosyltransferase involved in cell wall biosynthesis
MRVVMVSHLFPRAEEDVAGASIWRLAEAIARRGHEVTVVAPSDRGDVGESKLGEVSVRRVRYARAARETLAYRGSVRPFRDPFTAVSYGSLIWTMARATGDAVKQVHAQVIHAHFALPSGLAVRLAARAGRPYVVTLHEGEETQMRRVPGGRRLTAWVLEGAGTLTAVTSAIAAQGAELIGAPRERFTVTPMPIALGLTAHPDSARSGAIFVGRLERASRVDRMLDALAEVKRRGRLIDVTIVGDGAERAALKARAISLGLNADFSGYLDPGELSRRMRDKRLLILPAVDDEAGTVVAEALTHGVPIVAARGGAMSDLFLDPDAGLLLSETDISSFADAIRAVAEGDRFTVGAQRAGRVLVERRSPEKLAQQWEAIYTKARAAGTRASVAG